MPEIRHPDARTTVDRKFEMGRSIIINVSLTVLILFSGVFVLSGCSDVTDVEPIPYPQEKVPPHPETERTGPPVREDKPISPIPTDQDDIESDTWTDSADNPTYEDVRYGQYGRNVLDFWRAKSSKPTPVLIYFHGGGFVAGDKDKFRDNKMLEYCLHNSISVVSANYRYVKQSPFPAPFEDGARVVQFVRWKAAEWNIDQNRVVAMGGSAGAGIALWIALRDDMANVISQDPVAQQSTRLSCALVSGAQTFYDPLMILEYIGGNPEVHPSLPFAFGVDSIKGAIAPDKRELALEVSAIHFVTADDPPVYLSYGSELTRTPLPEDTPISISIHHPKFGQMLKREYDSLGLECILRYKGDGLKTESQADFLLKYLCID